MKKESVLVVFGEKLPRKWEQFQHKYDVVITSNKLKPNVQEAGFQWIAIEEMIGPGSIYEASTFAEELSHLKLPNGTPITKALVYEGYELWWMHYNNLYTYFCLPYTQYKKLLAYLKDFHNVYIYQPPYKTLFSCYLRARGSKMHILSDARFKSPAILPFGILIQILISLLCLPILIIKRPRLMVFIGDKFEASKDYDFRMRFVYQELRQRKIYFVEFIRSLESWKTILQHFFIRKRSVIYSEGVALLGRFASFLTGGRRLTREKFGEHIFVSERDPEVRFKLLVATHYLRDVYSDIWAIRIMKWILGVISVKAALFTAVLDRNFHAFAGCKLHNLPTVGILHGIASHHYIVYDFLPGFRGNKMLSVDKYGMWSEWCKEYYLKYSRAYRPDQLYISGPMRPLEKSNENSERRDPNVGSKGLTLNSGTIDVLFISEQLASPMEVIPYLEKLMNEKTINLSIKFRPYRDGFEEWLIENRPDLLKVKNIKILRGSIQEAVKECDVIVGSHSTAVLEALLQFKMPLFFDTNKWGDCFSLKEYGRNRPFFAENPDELVERIKAARSVSADTLKELQERYFGDPYRNGSKWVVDQLSNSLGELLGGETAK